MMASVLPGSIDGNNIEALKEKLAELESVINEKWDTLVSETEASTIALAMHCHALINEYQRLVTVLLTQYQAVINRLNQDQEVMDGAMMAGQKTKVQQEMKEFEGIVVLGLKDETADIALDGQVFSTIMTQFEEKCPLLQDILNTLLVTSGARRSILKTPQYRMKCGVNALACLLNVRTQYADNDVNLLFGLLCTSYGAGKQFVNMLHAMGLTPHWDTL